MGDIRLDGLARAALEAIRNMDEISTQGVNDLKASSPIRTDGYEPKKKPGTCAKIYPHIAEVNESAS